MKKTHYEHGPHGTACGTASAKTSANVYRVDCLSCKNREQFIAAWELAETVRHEKFLAQTPHTVREPWKSGNMECSQCAGDQFRIGDRTCYGHYQDYVCADCGHKESRLTEHGMQF